MPRGIGLEVPLPKAVGRVVGQLRYPEVRELGRIGHEVGAGLVVRDRERTAEPALRG